MALKTTVKLSDVTNLSDARYGAGMGVQFVGFPLGPDAPLDATAFREISEWLSGPAFVGEFGALPADAVREAAADLDLAWVETSEPPVADALQGGDLSVILRLSEPDPQRLDGLLTYYGPRVDYLLLDGRTTPWDEEALRWLRAYAHLPLLVGSGLTTDNLDAALDTGVAGISLRGGQEERPGFRNFDELADLLESLETD